MAYRPRRNTFEGFSGLPLRVVNSRSQRSTVYNFLRDRAVNDSELMKWLTKDTGRISARELDFIRPESYATSR